MNNTIKTIVGSVAIIAITILIGTTASRDKKRAPEVAPVNEPEVLIISDDSSTPEKTSTEQSFQTSTDADIELRRDRDGGARGAQKQNKEASDLQNDLNNINNP